MTQTFPCPACGAPNNPVTGQNMMACAYCSANLSIPDELSAGKAPSVANAAPKADPVFRPEIEAANFIRKAQPVAVGAWNLFALWTWVRRAIPACLTIIILGCVALGLIPLLWSFAR